VAKTLLGVTRSGEPADHDYCKIIRKLPVNLIDAALVLKVLRPVWETKTETASRLRGRIETILDYAKVALKLREGDNTARWEGNLEYSLPNKSKVASVENHPALPYAQMAAFMRELRQRKGIAARALDFTILCAARTNETIGALRTDIDWDKKTWTIPKERMKGEKGKRKQDHVVPLSATALAILEDLPEDGEHLFPLASSSMAAVIDRINDDRCQAGLAKWVDPKQGGRAIVPHGFRSSFKDWASEEEIAHDNNLSEIALSHTLPDKVEAAYRRGTMLEKRRRLMADWAAHCEGRVVGGANVVALRC
jgi:integrase